MVGDHVRVKGMFVHMRELDEAFSKLPEVCRFQLVLKLVDQRDRIALSVETDAGVDRKALSEAINKRCQDVFKLRMDEINYLSKGALPQDAKKVVDSRW
jgi:phenylacetate-CoA ligase